MSGLVSMSKDRCTVKHPFTPIDLKNLTRFMFGANRFNSQELGRFVSCMGPVSITNDGHGGAVWQVGERAFASAQDFREIMSVLPLRNRQFNGDMYLTANVLGQTQFLVLPFQGEDLLWFRSEKELTRYYEESDDRIDLDKLVYRRWSWQSVSV